MTLDKILSAFKGRAIPLEKQQAATMKNFIYNHNFTCKCGANLRIRAKENRKEGPSNFKALNTGHSALPSSELTWFGLVEERGWKVKGNSVECPACQKGMTVAEYKSRKL